MSNIEAVTVNDTHWVPLADKAEPNSRAWTNGRDTLFLRHFPLPPNIPAPLSRLDLIWKIDRLQNFWEQVAPVDIYTGTIGTAEYLAQIVKFSFNGPTQYQGSLIIPKSTFSLKFIVAAENAPDDEDREDHVEQAVLGSITDVDERAQRWFRDPFSFGLVTPMARNRADDEEWDEMFPSHPLSRIRAILRALPSMCEIDPEVLHAPAFVGPAATPELEQQLGEYAAFFSVSDDEQAELDDLSRELTPVIEKLAAESGLDSSTEALFVEPPDFAKSALEGFAAQLCDEKASRPRSAKEGSSPRPPGTAESRAEELPFRLRQIEGLAPLPSREFANAIAQKVSEHKDPKLCLIMYSSKRDPTFYQSFSALSHLHAAKHNDPRALDDAEIMASAELFQWEFIISRLLRGVNMRCVSVRSPDLDKCRTGVALIPAGATDWLAKFIALCEMSSMIVCATMVNPNMGRELGIAFGVERNRAKFLYRSSDGMFHLGSEQKHAFAARQLPEVAGYLFAKKLGIPVQFKPAKR